MFGILHLQHVVARLAGPAGTPHRRPVLPPLEDTLHIDAAMTPGVRNDEPHTVLGPGGDYARAKWD